MMHWSLYICLFPALQCVVASKYWTYEDSDGWKNDYSLCGGQEQSPVNLQTFGMHTNVATLEEMTMRNFNYKLENYDQFVSGNLSNDGRTLGLELHVVPKLAPALAFDSDDMSNRYELKYLDLHFRSPHLVDGIRYEMEMHMEHEDEYGNIALVTTLFEKCELASEIANILLNKIDTLVDPGSYVHIPPFSANLLLPVGTNEEELCDIMTYRGSMIRPPCKEGIFYLVLLQTLCITEEQFVKLEDLKDEYGNFMEGFRSEQPINERMMDHISCENRRT